MPFDKNTTFAVFNIDIIFYLCLFFIWRCFRLTNSISSTQWIHVTGLFMSSDNANLHWAMARRNWCLHHAIIKLKLNLFNIITTVSQVIVFLLAILHLCISKVNIVSCFYYLLYYATCCLRTHSWYSLSLLQIQIFH